MSSTSAFRLQEVVALAKQGEGPALEFKRSSGEIKEGMQTLCAFLNGSGGTVLFGIRSNGGIEGQDVSEQTFHDVAQAAERFEPAAHFSIHRVRLTSGKEVVALTIKDGANKRPFTYEGRAYERVGNTTRKMPQSRYEGLLLARAHGQHRWENEPADGVTIKDIDRQEVFRVLEAARVKGYLLEPVGKSVSGVLDRLGVRQDDRILQAAVVLFGKKFLPDYPQCELRMARFRGVDKAEFMDQRNVRAPAFKLLEEAELFCQRHFPLPGKIVSGKLQRQDKPLIPPDAMREILVNALIHRDYAIAGGAISLAIFDDRVEIWSAGRFPQGITPAALSREHASVQRNPIIADVFHRAGLIEKWGRGTNRVIEMCKASGVAPPEFEEITGAAVVRFRVNVLGAGRTTPQVDEQFGNNSAIIRRRVEAQVRGPRQNKQSRDQSEAQSRDQSKAQSSRVIAALLREPLSAHALAEALGMAGKTGALKRTLSDLLMRYWIEYILPDKPNSRLQKYRLTDAGKRILEKSR